jgi:microcystin-dependent protein
VSNNYVGEIRIFAGNFPPNGWMFCQGQLLPISENDVLFQLIGTTYGGDGQSTFALPDLRGRVPVHMGQGPGISQNYQIGQNGGVEQVTLTAQQIPSHTHALTVSQNTAQDTSPTNKVLGQIGGGALPYIQDVPDTNLNTSAVSIVGGSQPHTNFQPYLCLNFIISLFGVFPSQT